MWGRFSGLRRFRRTTGARLTVGDPGLIMRIMRASGGGPAVAGFWRNRGIPLFSVMGIRVVADYSWFLIVALIAGSLSLGWFPNVIPDRTTIQYVSLGLITAFFFFASVLVHELAHSIVSVLHGIPVRRITLFLFGGIAEISREPSDPATELKIALAGPVVSAVLATIFWGVVILFGIGRARPAAQFSFLYLAVSNTFLLLFNLLPGLPLDGGRVLRALIWRATGSMRRATYMASMAGKALAVIMIAFGLLLILATRQIISGLWLIMIAMFLRQAADASYRQAVTNQTSHDIRVCDVMTRDVVIVQADATLADLFERNFLHQHFICYPVMNAGVLVGYISIKDVARIDRDAWRDTSVQETMTRLTPENVLSPTDTIAYAISVMSGSDGGRLAVVQDGKLVGIVTRGDIMKSLRTRTGPSSR